MDQERKPRERLLLEAARLLSEVGTGVSTRAICEAAGVTAPTLYHYFGDRAGLLEAVVAHGFAEYLDRKRGLESTGDPIEDIRRGWDDHVAWGTGHPAFYALMYGQVRPGHHAPAADEAQQLLLEKLEAAAAHGLLSVPPRIAVRMILSANVGLTLLLISEPDAASDDLAARVRDAMLASILSADAPARPAGVAVSAIALRAALESEPPEAIAASERPLLEDWLDRLAINS